MKRSTSKIEDIAIAAMTNEVNLHAALLSDFASMDKKPIWDGNIYVYDDERHRNIDHLGKIPVQIKGKEVASFSEQIAKFPIKTTSLISYRNDFGVLFCVVEILEGTTDTKIFCEALLPFDLNDILEKIGEQQSKTIDIHELHRNELSNLDIVCRNFLQHRRKQRNERNIPLESIVGVESLHLSILTSAPYFLDSFVQNPNYLYAITANNISIPVEKTQNIEMAVIRIPFPVAIADTVYFDHYTYTSNKDGASFFQFGGNVQLYPMGRVKYTDKGLLSRRIKSLKFITSIMRDKKLKINGKEIPICFDETEDNVRFKTQLTQRLDFLSNLSKLLQYLGVAKDIDVADLSESDFRMLASLLRFIILRQTEIRPFAREGAHVILVYGMHIALFYNNNVIYNYFGRNFASTIRLVKENDEEDAIHLSPYVGIGEDVIRQCVNFDPEIVLESIMENSSHANAHSHHTLLLLEAIKAYDADRSNVQLKKFIYDLSAFLAESGNEDVYHVNMLQVIARDRALNTEEMESLRQIKQHTSEPSLICGVSILLGDMGSFHEHFNKLSDKEKEAFMQYPITKLMSDAL